jgi:hypothetical protein
MSKIEIIKTKGSKIKIEFRKKIVGYIVAAFGLVAGLAWNEAVKALIDYLFPMSQNGLWAKFVYAIIITLILVIVTIYLTRFIAGEEASKEAKKGK